MRQMDMMNIMDRQNNMIDTYDGYDKCPEEWINMMYRQIDITNIKISNEKQL